MSLSTHASYASCMCSVLAGMALPSMRFDGCVVCNVYEHETAIGEWVLMVMLALTRRLIVYDRDLRAGDWHTAFSYGGKPERDLRGSVVGCIGVGSIGSRVVELARSFGMRAIAVTRAPTPERAALLDVEWLGSMDDLQRLLSESDFTVVCVPLTETTAGLLGPAELELIGPTGYLVNVARGAIVQEAPLYEALHTKSIAGAGLDVWYRYPEHVGQTVMPASLPFWENRQRCDDTSLGGLVRRCTRAPLAVHLRADGPPG